MMATRILVVEDDAAQGRLLVHALQRAGHQAAHAGGVEAAFDLLGQDDFDLVVVDLFLPDGDGFALCQSIRYIQGLPVVMVSSMEADVGEALIERELGPQAFLSKPFPLPSLIAQVDDLLMAAT